MTDAKSSAGAKPRMTKQEVRALVAIRRNEALRRAREVDPVEEPVIRLSLGEAHAILRALHVKSPRAAEEFATALTKVKPGEA